MNFMSETKKRKDLSLKTSNCDDVVEHVMMDFNDADCCFVYTDVLSDFIKIVKCASCNKQSLIIQEVSEKRKGLATVLSLTCVNKS